MGDMDFQLDEMGNRDYNHYEVAVMEDYFGN